MIQLLARFRVALGFVAGALVFVLADPTWESLAAGLAVAAVGEALRVWAAGHLYKSREVTSSGPYRWCAHPLYLGSSVMGVGLAVASASPIAAVLILLYLFITLRAAITNEEAALRRAFGDQYDRYRRGHASAGGGASGGSERRFSLAQAVANREYRAVVGLIAAILLLVLKATYNGAF
jgi:protein-S-isoprenylcysteine O-methyltransferase Ste14